MENRMQGYAVTFAVAAIPATVLGSVTGRATGIRTRPVRTDMRAAIRLADGRTATVRFSNQGGGGTFELRAADQSLLTSGALPTRVLAPPLFAKPE